MMSIIFALCDPSPFIKYQRAGALCDRGCWISGQPGNWVCVEMGKWGIPPIGI